MKFKTVILLFNIAIIVSFLFIFAMPFMVLGSNYALTFWKTNWILASTLFLVLVVVNFFFITNGKMFTLLEREDWPALSHYLEDRVIGKKQYNSRLVRLLANTYLVLADTKALNNLEAQLRKEKPALLKKNTLVFGISYLLQKETGEAKTYFAGFRGKGCSESEEWVEWYYAFCLMMEKQFEAAAEVLLPLAKTAQDGILAGLIAFFLATTLANANKGRRADYVAAADGAKSRVLKKLPSKQAWSKELERARAEIHVVVMGKSITDAENFLYS